MKKIFVFCLMCIGSPIIYAQDYFMYVGGEKHYFEISPNKIIVQFEEKATTISIKNAVQKNIPFQLSNISETNYKGLNLISFSNTDKRKVIELTRQLKNQDEILYSGLVFIDKNGRETSAIINQIAVRLKQESDYSILQKSIIPYGINIVKQDEFDNRTYLLNIDYSSKKKCSANC
jgi:hypothetical protein